MTALNVFPTLPGLGWDGRSKTPMWRTRTQTTVSGRELRIMDQTVPRWKWALPFTFLRDGSDNRSGAGFPGLGTGYTEAEELIGFFNQQNGSFLPFLLDDPTDDNVTQQQVGTANGSTTQFQLVRTLGGMLAGGGFTEPIYAPNAVTAVYVDGVQQTGGYGVSAASLTSAGTLDPGGLITFGAAPTSGPVTATFSYYWPVRFLQDSNEFEYFLYQLWQAKKIEFISELP